MIQSKTQEHYIIQVCDETKELLIKKNRDYNNSFSRQFEEFGIMCALIRMSDKMERLKNLIKNESKREVMDESIIDTLRDLSGYCNLTIVEYEKMKEKK